ncbi:MAG: hypothetical protein GEV08_21085 [Acidimicrobiia bacterium]|nr:hypothetical protein [Acidimicrobiia bacterium]
MQLIAYDLPDPAPLWALAIAVNAVAVAVAAVQAFRLDRGSPARLFRRALIRARWGSVARSAGLAVVKDKRRVAQLQAPPLSALVSGPVDRASGGQARVKVEPVERLPKLAHGRATPSKAAVVYRVKPPRGGSLDDIAGRVDHLAAAMRAYQVTLERVRPDRGRLIVTLHDELTKVRPWPGPGRGVGVTATGEPLRFPLIGGHWLIAGVTRSGKSVWLQSVIADVLTSRVPRYITAIDPKVVELSLVAPAVDRLIVDPAEIGEALAAEHHEVTRRYQQLGLRGLQKLERPTEDMPLRLIIVDELGEVARQGPGETKDAPKERLRLLSSLAAIGGGAGVVIICCTQRPSAQLIGSDLRANLTRRICCRTSDEYGGEAALGDIAGQLRPQDIPMGSKGVAWVVSEEHPYPQQARSYWLTSEQIAAIAQAHPAPRPAALEAGG